ncbi:MAG: uroporphyrinogen-III C-methyltransferase [Eggerthellaceae bacterium]|nr:uroporphyrinogen-III C-methyltransferase [Eggerthellaceae bacterium]
MGEKMGKVWLVGAGPGDAGLLTRKGYDVLQAAEVVVYDALVGDGVLALVPSAARKIDVGKRAANHTMRQEQISQVLLDEALAGNLVVRLKGGDPFVFGRGGEELELLAEHGVPYEVIPGITSAIAVPAYNGIPVTHRDFTSSLHIITGHKREGADYDIDFEALVRTKGTLVFLMGVRSLPDIMAGLMDAGMDPATPAAVLQEGTTAGQRRVVATLSTLAEEADRAQIQAPAIIVVGGVCSLADQFAWREKLPLQGCKVLVTRPAEVISTMSERLRKLGAEVLDLPAIATVPYPVDASIEEAVADEATRDDAIGTARGEKTPLATALDKLSSYDWIVFTSPSGVRIFFDQLLEAGKDLRSIAGARFAALGQGTSKELMNRGFVADLVPVDATGEALGQALAKVAEPGSKILIPRALIGGNLLVDALVAAGHEVDDVPTYDTAPVFHELVDVAGEFEQGKIFCVAFTSSSGVKAFAKANPSIDLTAVRAACIGEQTRKTADALGMRTWTSDHATMDDLADLIVRMYADSQNS